MSRPATTHDAIQAAPLLCAAWGGLTRALTGADDDAEAQQIVADFFAQTGNRVSHENALVAEADGRVVGVAVCYGGEEAARLDRPLTARLIARTGDPTARVHVEAAPDEFYLDTLSVHPDYRGAAWARNCCGRSSGGRSSGATGSSACWSKRTTRARAACMRKPVT